MNHPIPIDLSRVPGAMLICNHLDDRPTAMEFDQDLVLVELPGGDTFIDVSWAPEHDPGGKYHLTVARRDAWDAPLREGTAGSPSEAAAMVVDLAERFADPDPPTFGWTKSGFVARQAAREFSENTTDGY